MRDARKIVKNQDGAVAIFIVIFFALLLSVITLGFVRLTSQDQHQALVTDLSQSAFDSAEAGVEDAKRALIQYTKACGGADDAQCQAYTQAFQANQCSTLAGPLAAQLGLSTDGKGAVRVETNSDDKTLDQAYTCLKISLSTADYIRKIEANTSDLVPLRGTGNFSSVTINWFLASDAGLAPGAEFSLPRIGGADYSPAQFPSQELWGEATPPVMRVQLIEHNKNAFSQRSLEDGSSTLFLYPTENSGVAGNQVAFTRYARKSPNEPVQVTCTKDTGGYACSATLLLSGSLAMNPSKAAYLRVTSLYKGSTYQLQLNGGAVQFNGVQPSVDSTGRANTIYRRVQSRIRFDEATGGYPENALETTNDICKDFAVSSEPLTLGSCQPKALP